MQIHRCLICILLACLGGAFSSSNVGGIEASNILGGPGQHASFSFVRPGLTQTSYAFNGPSSHQTFSSSVGDAHLAGRVQPSLAGALSYRNPGLAYYQGGGAGYVPISPTNTIALPYPYSQEQQFPQYQEQIADLQVQPNSQQLAQLYMQQQQELQVQQVAREQQQPQAQNLLGIAYSAAPSVANVKINANGVKYNF